MNVEVAENKLINRTVAMLRMARQVIEKMHSEMKGESFQEEPSLSDLVLVAQIIGQNSAIDRMGEMSGSHDIPASPPGEGFSKGELLVALPDVVVFWSQEPLGWFVNVKPEFQQETQFCKTSEELLLALQQAAAICGMHRPQSPQEPKQP